MTAPAGGTPRGDGTTTETICQEADRLVAGDRQADYGHPYDAYTDMAIVWGVIAKAPLTAEQVVLMLTAMKLLREANKTKRDNRVDLAGYAKVLDMVVEERASRASVVGPAPEGEAGT